MLLKRQNEELRSSDVPLLPQPFPVQAMASIFERAGHLYSRPAPPTRAFPKERPSTWGRWRGMLDKVFMVLDYAKLAEHLRCWQPLLPPPQLAADSGSTKAKLSPSARLTEIESAIGGKPLPPMKSSKPATENAATCSHPAASCRIFANGSTKRSVACQLCHSRWESHSAEPAATSSASSAPAPAPKAKAVPQHPYCQCKLAGKMYVVKKPGPTQGRHFYKCPRHICKWFAWDPMEVETLLTEHMHAQAPQGQEHMTAEQRHQYEYYQEQMRQHLQQQEQEEDEWEEVPME